MSIERAKDQLSKALCLTARAAIDGTTLDTVKIINFLGDILKELGPPTLRYEPGMPLKKMEVLEQRLEVVEDKIEQIIPVSSVGEIADELVRAGRYSVNEQGVLRVMADLTGVGGTQAEPVSTTCGKCGKYKCSCETLPIEQEIERKLKEWGARNLKSGKLQTIPAFILLPEDKYEEYERFIRAKHPGEGIVLMKFDYTPVYKWYGPEIYFSTEGL